MLGNVTARLKVTRTHAFWAGVLVVLGVLGVGGWLYFRAERAVARAVACEAAYDSLRVVDSIKADFIGELLAIGIDTVTIRDTVVRHDTLDTTSPSDGYRQAEFTDPRLSATILAPPFPAPLEITTRRPPFDPKVALTRRADTAGVFVRWNADTAWVPVRALPKPAPPPGPTRSKLPLGLSTAWFAEAGWEPFTGGFEVRGGGLIGVGSRFRLQAVVEQEVPQGTSIEAPRVLLGIRKEF